MIDFINLNRSFFFIQPWSLEKCDVNILFVTETELRLKRIFSTQPFLHRPLTKHGWINTGYETVRPGTAYNWDGLKRGGQASRPTWIFQFTLHGWGWFEASAQKKQVSAGSGFSARIPSRHRYYADPACEEWTFFWLITHQPYAVERIAKCPPLHNRLVSLPGDAAAPLPHVLDLLEAMEQDAYSDPYRIEALLLNFVYELERWTFLAHHPKAERDTLLTKCHALIRENAERFLDVSDLAKSFGMSRTHFSHHFRRLARDSPAAFIRKQKLRQVETLLTASSLSIKEIAAQTGFTDSNHLCKAFRAHFQCSPGGYRRIATSSAASIS